MGRKKSQTSSSSILLSSSTSTSEPSSSLALSNEALSPHGTTQRSSDYVKADLTYEVSEDDSDSSVDVVLGTSRVGLLAKYDNIGATYNRVWTAGEDADVEADDEKERMIEEWLRAKEEGDQTEEQLRVLEKKIGEEKEKLEEVRQKKRRIESEENAGRDPTLFSKRTAFDISLSLVEDKVSETGGRGGGGGRFRSNALPDSLVYTIPKGKNPKQAKTLPPPFSPGVVRTLQISSTTRWVRTSGSSTRRSKK